MNKTIFFRNDDVQDVNENLKKFLSLFLYYRIPVHLAVVPGRMTLRCKLFLQQLLRKYPKWVEVGQHGYKHVNYSQDPMRKYEFGLRRDYSTQRKDIVRGGKILAEITGDNLIFTPPWNGFNENTLKILSELGFLGVSLDRKAKISYHCYVKRVVTSVYFNKRKGKGWFVDKEDIIFNEIKATQGVSVGVETHHGKFKSDQEFKELRGLLSRLRKMPGIRFCKLSEQLL